VIRPAAQSVAFRQILRCSNESATGKYSLKDMISHKQRTGRSATEEFMKYILMAGASGMSVLMISALLVLSVRDDMRQDTREAAATPHSQAVIVARS
jgi:hypothetical protein